jgi:hypothetical protein
MTDINTLYPVLDQFHRRCASRTGAARDSLDSQNIRIVNQAVQRLDVVRATPEIGRNVNAISDGHVAAYIPFIGRVDGNTSSDKGKMCPLRLSLTLG